MEDSNGFSPKSVASVIGAVALTFGILAITLATGGLAAPVLVGAAVGGLSGFAIDAGTQYFTNGRNFGKIDWDSATISGSFGMVSGALGGSGETVRAQVLGNATLGAGQSYYRNPNEGIGELAFNTIAGGIAGKIGGTGAQNLKGYKGGFMNEPSPYDKGLRSKAMCKSACTAIGRTSVYQAVVNVATHIGGGRCYAVSY